DAYGTTVSGIPSPLTGYTPQPVSFTLTGLALNTTYHYRVVSTNWAVTSYGADMTFTTLATPYCIPVYSSGCSEYSMGLSQFNLNTISQAILCEGTPSYYHDFTSSTTTDLAKNGYYSISIQAGYWDTYVTVWADYNHNNFFEEGNEIVGHAYCYNTGQTYTIPFIVPASAANGTVRLRAMSNYYWPGYNYPTNPCSVSEYYGNCSDFTVNITDALTPPTVTTLAANGVTPFDAVLNGTVNANDNVTNVEFHYGTNNSFGNTITGDPGTVTGTMTTDVSASLTGLSPHTIYYFKATGFGNGGFVSGDTLSFITDSISPTVTTYAVTSLAGTTVTLQGGVNANNLNSVVFFEYGLDDTYGTTVNGSPLHVNGFYEQSVSAMLTGLSVNTTYHYRVGSTNSVGTSYGEDMTFTTLNTQYCVPSFGTGCNTYNMGLTYFALNTIAQSISCSGTPNYYHNFPVSTDINKSSSYTISVRVGYSYEYVRFWIDYNHNDVFDAGSELVASVYCNNTYSTFTASFTVPASALTGATTLRALTSYDGYPPNPCSYYEYGNCADFGLNILPSIQPPTVTTSIATANNECTATSGGNVTDEGGTSVTERGVCWSILANPVYSDPHTSDSSGAGIFVSNITGLNTGTTYHVRAYATNSNGTSYGNDVNFTTTAIAITGSLGVCTGSTTTLGSSVAGGTWSSTVTSVATVDPSTGVVTGVSVGQSVITYTYTNASACVCVASVTVTVYLSPASPN
ncbi:MAG: GEVED domain-containing protein, partial [Bacteroidota bacterium]